MNSDFASAFIDFSIFTKLIKGLRRKRLGRHVKRIYRFVLTGGPCSGKTSALAALEQTLTKLGYKVIIVPEAATKILDMGIAPFSFPGRISKKPTTKQKAGAYSGNDFQNTLIRRALLQELEAEEYADRWLTGHPDQDIVIIYDRGIADGLAYIEPKVFARLLARYDLTPVELLGDRYDHIFDLQTAAVGTNAYNRTSNIRRKETKKQAAELGRLTRQAWTGCEHVTYIDNADCASFEHKMQRVVEAFCLALGIPVPIEDENKYLIRPVPKIRVHHRIAYIQQIYLRSPKNVERRIRMRTLDSPNGDPVFFYTEKRKPADSRAGRLENQRIISYREFVTLSLEADHRYGIITKQRAIFPWQGNYIEVDRFGHNRRLWVMEIEKTAPYQKVSWPSWIKVIRDVTEEPEYSNRRIAWKIRNN